MAHIFEKNRKGVTLVELMAATVIISIGVLGMVGAFRYINFGIQAPKGRSLANNLAQEKIEVLKNKSYFRVMVTTATGLDHHFDPDAYEYDTYPNGSEALNVGGINFTRRVWIRKVSENSDGELTLLNWNLPDTGLKEIIVYVSWFEGGSWKKVELRNLRGNPDRTNLSAMFTGTVLEAGAGTPPIQGAIVRAQENPARYDTTDASGAYGFAIETGSYTLQASRQGFFSSVSPLYIISTTQNHPFTLTRMSSGTITGTAWLRDHLVISQVVGSSLTAYGEQEWVEVYNPTTWTWTMATGLGTGANDVVVVSYKESVIAEVKPDFDYRTVSVAPNSYFLFANTGTITAVGIARAADAVYDRDSNWANQDEVIVAGDPSPAGYVILGSKVTGQILDKVGWNATDNGNAAKTHAESYEGQAIIQGRGLQEDEQYVRRSQSSGVAAGVGRAYDSNNNQNDFTVSASSMVYPPRNSGDVEAPVTGTPAAGAPVFASDGLSSSTQAMASGAFTLSGVATGYWTLYVSSGMSISTGGVYGGASSGFAAAAGAVVLSTDNVFGFITGVVTGINGVGIVNIKVAAGSRQATTDPNGRYLLPTDPGEQTVWANYHTDNTSYIETSSMGVTAELGRITENVDFVLQPGGKLRGWITTNGTDPLPNVPVSAFESNVEQGNGITDSNGYFLIWGTGISTGTYAVVPQLEDGESSSPSTHSVTLVAGDTAFVGTFTVTGAMGAIRGSVTAGGVNINTGVLIYATTTTLTGSPIMPPTMGPTTRAGTVKYYAVSSNAQGYYDLPVRGGSAYNIYAWYTTWNSNEAAAISVRQSTAAVAAGQIVTENFSW